MNVNYKTLCVILSMTIMLIIGGTLCYFNRQLNLQTREAVMNNILTRSSVRSYSSKPIDKGDLIQLVKAGMAAPSGGNAQPCEFIIITDKKVLADYAMLHSFAPMSTQAAAAIAVVINTDTYINKPNLKGYAPQDAAAATENILLAAHAMGLGAVWTGIYSENTPFARNRMRRSAALLKLSSNKVAFALVLLGHPHTATSPKNKWDANKVSWMQ